MRGRTPEDDLGGYLSNVRRENAEADASIHGGRHNGQEPLRRGSLYSFRCHRCCRCCRGKVIRVNPYEVARLAQHLVIGTGEFLKQYTVAGGTALRVNAKGVCVFLSKTGCAVHPARPLVCRLYPLGRHVGNGGGESFSGHEPFLRCRGISGRDGTVGKFLEEQGAGPFLAAVDRYLDLVGLMSAALRDRIGPDPDSRKKVDGACKDPLLRGPQPAPAWLDMDEVVSAYCAARKTGVPSDATLRMEIHIAAITELLDKSRIGGYS